MSFFEASSPLSYVCGEKFANRPSSPARRILSCKLFLRLRERKARTPRFAAATTGAKARRRQRIKNFGGKTIKAAKRSKRKPSHAEKTAKTVPKSFLAAKQDAADNIAEKSLKRPLLNIKFRSISVHAKYRQRARSVRKVAIFAPFFSFSHFPLANLCAYERSGTPFRSTSKRGRSATETATSAHAAAPPCNIEKSASLKRALGSTVSGVIPISQTISFSFCARIRRNNRPPISLRLSPTRRVRDRAT